jgi:hypothetical protein
MRANSTKFYNSRKTANLQDALDQKQHYNNKQQLNIFRGDLKSYQKLQYVSRKEMDCPSNPTRSVLVMVLAHSLCPNRRSPPLDVI